MDSKLKAGTKVHYDPGYKTPENGIIKSIDGDHAFVVYNWADDWKKYADFTGARTPMDKIRFGWVDEKGNLKEEFCDHEYQPSAGKWEPINKMTCMHCGKVIND